MALELREYFNTFNTSKLSSSLKKKKRIQAVKTLLSATDDALASNIYVKLM